MRKLFVYSFLGALLLCGSSHAQDTVIGGASTNKAFHETAVEAAIWGMPIVAMDAMRQAYLRDAKANYNDVVQLPMTWKNQITTPNSSSIYLYINYNTKDGPVVIEIPAAEGGGVFGAIDSAWQVPLADFGPKGLDKGKGGKYLILPPDYKGKVPAGYFQVKSDTFNGYSLIRAIPISTSKEDKEKVMTLVKKIRVYALAQASSPPNTRFIDMSEKLFDGIARYNETFYETLARMINEEPVLEHDKAMMRKLKSIGIEKGKPFESGSRREEWAAAIDEAHEFFKKQLLTKSVPWTRNRQWGMSEAGINAVKSGFTYKSGNKININDRAVTFFLACAPAKSMGDATVYLSAFKDGQNQVLDGSSVYRLRVPANVPVEQFWSVNVYDLDTAGFIREAPVVGIDSYNQKMSKNADGTTDIYFGPKPPTGKENNWIYTAPGKQWFTFFRFYGPKKAVQDKTWILPDIEKISPMKQAAM
ncbi:DUF1254 domain-containing protein [Bdellovibrio sp. 22V]|uniref:DUF1254 domain-containing protein n=1 Tax=Bdellovibrio sp. 22V TaxID=3044166 RepID=UPI00254340C8|nr:DUF1254 domain-containing protein [Bdellovibrio sp. 22V]WII71998.1 DUF1254 domain-containing protein [Bdellovibrio sp. 22V]